MTASLCSRESRDRDTAESSTGQRQRRVYGIDSIEAT